MGFVFREDSMMKKFFCFFDRCFGFFSVPSFQLAVFWLFVSLLGAAAFFPGGDAFAFLDFLGFAYVFVLLVFFPLSLELLRPLCAVFFFVMVLLAMLYFHLFALVFGGA
jgi:hypothetical protein